VPAELKDEVEGKVSQVRELLGTENTEELRQATQALMQVVSQIGAAAYQQGDPQAGGGPEGEPTPDGAPDDQDYFEGEFKEE
jgi:molecular chaperone DnaK